MKFTVNDIKENIPNLARKLGYRAIRSERGEFNCVRLLAGADYPRFHLFIKTEGDKFSFNLHLDQKKPSYSGTHSHSGEYDGDLVESEAERVKKLLRS